MPVFLFKYMSKIKTHKATSKRIAVTGTDKLRRRKAGRDHYNAKETGKESRLKRCDINADATCAKTIRTLMPYR